MDYKSIVKLLREEESSIANNINATKSNKILPASIPVNTAIPGYDEATAIIQKFSNVAQLSPDEKAQLDWANAILQKATNVAIVKDAENNTNKDNSITAIDSTSVDGTSDSISNPNSGDAKIP